MPETALDKINQSIGEGNALTTKVAIVNPHLHDHLPWVLGCLAEYFKKLRIPFEVIDLSIKDGAKKLAAAVAQYSPEWLYLSLATHPREYFHPNFFNQLLKEIKKKNMKIILGDSVPGIVGKEILLRYPEADYAIKGDAPYPLSALLNRISLSEIEGLIYRDGSEIHENPGISYFNLTEITYPSYDRFQLHRYHIEPVPVLLSLGCHHECVYCFHPLIHGHKYRMRHLRDVIDEISYWRQKGIRKFEFYDDNFGFSKQRMLDFL